MTQITRELIYSNIDEIMANADKLNSKQQVNIKDLLSDEFLKGETKFSSLSEIFAHFGRDDVSEESFSEIDDDHWDQFISAETKFDNWDDMFEKATSYYVRGHLFQGIV